MISPIERSLLDTYYGAGAPSAGMSSHWREYSGRFRVRVDDRGDLIADGVGFGEGRWHSRVHRLCDAVTRTVHLTHLAGRAAIRSNYRTAVAVVSRMALDPTLDVFRQACTVALLQSRLPASDRIARVVIIGDGFGVLGALLATWLPKAQVVFVDLGETLLFQAHHVRRAFPDDAHALIPGPVTMWPTARFVYCPSEYADTLRGIPCDLAINVASMQEMGPSVVDHYFDILRDCLTPAGHFYCCNRERKVMPGGEVSELERYPWDPADQILLDERCPWHQYYFAARGFAWVRGVPIPGLHRYDGPHRHRLVRMRVRQSVS